MSAQVIEAKVRSIIASHLGLGEAQIRLESSFSEDLGADSLDIVELVMAFEQAFELEISEEDQENIRTVKDAVDYIHEHTPAA